ncbi:MAG: hypothetical protein ACI4TI_02000 [Christensenellales bacterium]
MRYIKLSFKYCVKNILFLFLMSLIPAVFIGSLLSPFKFLEFINNYSNLVITGFADVFYSIIDISWLKILLYVLAFGLIGVFASVIVGEIENHFRSGKQNYYNFKNYINNNILNILLNLSIFVVINFIVSFLCGTIIYLFHVMICGLNSSANVGSFVVAIIIFTLYFCVISFVGLALLINVPNMMINGYNFKQAISNTINLLGKNFFALLLAYLVPYVIIIPLISIFNFSSVALHIVNAVCLIISIMYYSSFALTAYFDLTNLSRYDERKYFQIK